MDTMLSDLNGEMERMAEERRREIAGEVEALKTAFIPDAIER